MHVPDVPLLTLGEWGWCEAEGEPYFKSPEHRSCRGPHRPLFMEDTRSRVAYVKTCGSCAVSLPAERFDRRRESGDGLQNVCRSCIRIARLRRAHPDRRTRQDVGETATLYVRVPVGVKDGVERYAEAGGTSLARASSVLLGWALDDVDGRRAAQSPP
jgi:hypothetical protein